MIGKRTFAIRWKDVEANGYIDVLPTEIFASTGKKSEVTHDVRGPRGGSYEAKCDVTVSTTTADLDYTGYQDFNNRGGMCSGVLRLHFADPDRTSIARAEWKNGATSPFENADVEFVEPKFKVQKRKSVRVETHSWWAALPDERYWCEITDRPDIGADLKCPQTNEKGKPDPSYSLIRAVWPGDLVYHYSTRTKSFVGASVAGGPLEE